MCCLAPHLAAVLQRVHQAEHAGALALEALILQQHQWQRGPYEQGPLLRVRKSLAVELRRHIFGDPTFHREGHGVPGILWLRRAGFSGLDVKLPAADGVRTATATAKTTARANRR